MKSWVCTKCGNCCRHVGEVDGMRHMARPDGSCHFLTPDNLCEIYDRRPLICNVARVYAEYFSDTMTEEQFYDITEEACEKLRNESVSTGEGTDET